MTRCLNTISKPGKNVEIYSPFWKMSKSEIVKWMLDNVEHAEEILKTSVSCYSEDRGQCGNCPSCLRKAIAFEACDLKIDFYERDIRKYLLIADYIKNMKDGKYPSKRSMESLAVFKKWGWIV